LKIDLKKHSSSVLLVPQNNCFVTNHINPDWFNKFYWQQQNALMGQSKGRNITWFIKNPNDEIKSQCWVLRHYYRGGLMAKLVTDRFLFTGIKKTRCYKEVQLLQLMSDMGLPVPKPIAAMVSQKKMFYQADLLMEKIEAKDLVAILSQSNLPISQWRAIGEVIANFHCHGIYHADLNAHNILIDKLNKVWLIDFDRCKKITIQQCWQKKNLQRLFRSFEKEQLLNKRFYFDHHVWRELELGYQQRMEELK